jgi:hypothetical protein
MSDIERCETLIIACTINNQFLFGITAVNSNQTDSTNNIKRNII